MDNFFVTALISWFLPGAGHFKSGAWQRGIIVALIIWGMFVVGIASGGAYYPGYGLQEGFLLYLLNVFAKFGNGMGFIISWFLSQNPSPKAAAWATFEYGGRFLEVAGLLNYLAAMDAVDISLGRKK